MNNKIILENKIGVTRHTKFLVKIFVKTSPISEKNAFTLNIKHMMQK